MNSKRIFVAVLMLACILPAFSQTMRIFKTDGTSNSVNVSDIDSVTFEESEKVEYVECNVSAKRKYESIADVKSKVASSSSSDLYGVGIFKEDDNTGCYVSYINWCTDDLSSSTLRLQKGKKYKCCLFMIPDGKNIIYSNGTTYGNPFTGLGAQTPTFGAPCYGDSYDMYYARLGAAQIKFQQSYKTQANLGNSVDIYYGMTYVNTDSTTDIVVNLYRMVFGLDISVSNLTKGKVLVTCNNDYSTCASYNSYIHILEPSSPTSSLILEPYNMPWNGVTIDIDQHPVSVIDEELIKNWPGGCSVYVYYQYENGDIIHLFTKNIAGTRLTRYKLNFDVSQYINDTNGSVKVNVVNDEQWTEEYVK